MMNAGILTIVAEYTLVDSKHLLRLPEDLDPVAAAPILCGGMSELLNNPR